MNLPTSATGRRVALCQMPLFINHAVVRRDAALARFAFDEAQQWAHKASDLAALKAALIEAVAEDALEGAIVNPAPRGDCPEGDGVAGSGR